MLMHAECNFDRLDCGPSSYLAGNSKSEAGDSNYIHKHSDPSNTTSLEREDVALLSDVLLDSETAPVHASHEATRATGFYMTDSILALAAPVLLLWKQFLALRLLRIST